MISEIKGDLFDSKNSLAHCVSADYCMGAGIAVEFKKRFGTNIPKVKVGKVAYITEVDKTDNITIVRYIFYLVTKEKYWQKPTYASLKSTLQMLYCYLKELNIKSISIPRIGCGLDKLDWNKVKLLINQYMADIDVCVYKM